MHSFSSDQKTFVLKSEACAKNRERQGDERRGEGEQYANKVSKPIDPIKNVC